MTVRRAVAVARKPASQLTFGVTAVALLASLPDVGSADQVNVAFTLLTLAAAAQAWNVIGGFGGQFSLGHAAFIGAGAYGTTMLLLHTGIPVIASIVCSGVLAALVAFAVSFALFRLRGAYFAVGSLAVALAAEAWMVNWHWTGATLGLTIPVAKVPSPNTLYYEALAVTAFTIATAAALLRLPFGLRLLAVRDDEDAAAGLGVSAALTKRTAFVISAFLTGMVGSLIALQQISIDPTSMFGLTWTIDMVIITIVGGLGTVGGPVIGAVVVYYAIQRQFQSDANLGLVLTGLLLILIVRFAPDGVWGTTGRIARRLMERTPMRPP